MQADISNGFNNDPNPRLTARLKTSRQGRMRARGLQFSEEIYSFAGSVPPPGDF
jgi:hypothetical protein